MNSEALVNKVCGVKCSSIPGYLEITQAVYAEKYLFHLPTVLGAHVDSESLLNSRCLFTSHPQLGPLSFKKKAAILSLLPGYSFQARAHGNHSYLPLDLSCPL